MANNKPLNHDLPNLHDEYDSATSNHKNHMNHQNHSADKMQASVHFSKFGN